MSSGEVNKKRVFEADGRITEAGLAASNATLVDPPAVAIGLAGQGKTRGTAALVNTRLCTNQSIALIKGRTGVLDTTYLFHNLDGRYDELRTRSAGGGRAGLSRELLAAVPIALPDLSEQSRIAAVMDTLDEAIAKTAAVIAKLQQSRAGLLHDLLTRGLDKHGQLRDPIARPDQFQDSPLGSFPREWDCKTLEDAAHWSSGGTPSRSQTSWWTGNIPILTPKDMKVFEISDTIEHVTEEAALAGSKVMPAETAFIVVRGMILAHTFPVCLSTRPFAFNQDIKAVRGRDGLKTRFLAHWFAANSSLFLRKATEATHGTKKLDMPELHRVHIAVPKPDEQEEIVGRIEGMDSDIGVETRELGKLELLKSGLTNDLLTGRVRVPTTE
jgi:type I restriction enzyme, S subunit